MNVAAKNKNVVDLFVNDNLKMPIKQNRGRNLLCKSVQGNAQMPEKRLKIERIFTLNRDLPQTPVGLSANLSGAYSRPGVGVQEPQRRVTNLTGAPASRTTVYEHLNDHLLPLTQENFTKF